MNTSGRFKCFIQSFLLLACFAVTLEAQANFLSVNEAFALKADMNPTQNTVLVHFDIAPGYYLYREHFHFFSNQNDPVPATAITFPKAITKHDADLGDHLIYRKNVDILLTLPKDTIAKGLRIEYQGCAAAGFCYPTETKNITFSNEGIATITDSTTETPAVYESETSHITNLLQDSNLGLTLAIFFGMGILLAFTPCVLPMVPILANILTGNKGPLTKKRSLYLSGLYVLSMALCYTVAGVIAGLLGNHLPSTLQQPLVLVALSFLLLLFALSQFDLLQFQLPQVFANIGNQFGQKYQQGSALGAISMGMVSALVVSPCVTPALVAALAYIGQTGNAVVGGLALFVLAIGMGTPLMLAATLGSHLLPKAGAWMGSIKFITGLLLLVLAGSMLLRAVPLQASTDKQASIKEHGAFTLIATQEELNQAILNARQQGKAVLLDVSAEWCVACHEMDKEVFDNQHIQTLLKPVHLLRLDLTQTTPLKTDLTKSLNIIGPPTLIFFDKEGKEIKEYRSAGKLTSDDFINLLGHFLKT